MSTPGLLLCILLQLAAGLALSHADDRGPIRVEAAAFLPLTGSAAEQGAWIRDGLQLGSDAAREQFNVVLNFSLEETEADPRKAVAAYQQLRTRKSFPVMYSYGSGVGIALSTAANRDQIVQIGLATASPAYRSPDDFTFRNFPSAELESRFIANVAHEELAARSIGLVHIENDYGLGAASSFRLEIEKRGVPIVFQESIEPNSTDLRALIARLKARPVDLLYLALYPTEGALFLRQARALGLTTRALASVAILGSERFTELAGQAADGLLVATSLPHFHGSTSPAVQDFVRRYQAMLGSPPSVQAIFAARAYDAALITAKAATQCQVVTATCLRDELFKVRHFQGASGTLSFDHYGDVSSEFQLQRLVSGQFLPFGSDKAESGRELHSSPSR